MVTLLRLTSLEPKARLTSGLLWWIRPSLLPCMGPMPESCQQGCARLGLFGVALLKELCRVDRRAVMAALRQLSDQFSDYLRLHAAFSAMEETGRSLSEQQALLTEALTNQLSR